jgi:hypothetical protein
MNIDLDLCFECKYVHISRSIDDEEHIFCDLIGELRDFKEHCFIGVKKIIENRILIHDYFRVPYKCPYILEHSIYEQGWKYE